MFGPIADINSEMKANPLYHTNRSANEDALARVGDKEGEDRAKATKESLEAEKVKLFHQVLDLFEELQHPNITPAEHAKLLPEFNKFHLKIRAVEEQERSLSDK